MGYRHMTKPVRSDNCITSAAGKIYHWCHERNAGWYQLETDHEADYECRRCGKAFRRTNVFNNLKHVDIYKARDDWDINQHDTLGYVNR